MTTLVSVGAGLDPVCIASQCGRSVPQGRAALLAACADLVRDICELRERAHRRIAELLDAAPSASATPEDTAADEPTPVEAPVVTDPAATISLNNASVNRTSYTELYSRVHWRQQNFLTQLKVVYRVSLLVIKSKDGVLRSGLNIGSVPIVGWVINEGAPLKMSVSHKVLELDTVLLLQKHGMDYTSGVCGMLCDLLMHADNILQNPHQVRQRISQRRGLYYVVDNSHVGELTLPAEKRLFTQTSPLYLTLNKIAYQLCKLKYNSLLGEPYTPPFDELFVHVAHLLG